MVESVKVRQRVGQDGILHLEIPVGLTDQDVEVMVIYQVAPIDIQQNLKDGFEKQLFEAALSNLRDTENPLRFNNFAYATRELVRHILIRIAPDEELVKCSWYKNEIESRENGITRRQRVYYAVQGGLSNEYVRDILGIDIIEMQKFLKDAVDKMSKYTHIQEKTFNIDDSKVERFVEEALSAVSSLFSTVKKKHKIITSALWEQIDESTVDSALSETILSLDELSSHHSIEEVYTSDIQIITIDGDFIRFRAEGTIACELQWGSGSDMKRGDGAVASHSFPFTCELWSSVSEPEDIQAEEVAFSADTSSWWSEYTDE